MTRDMMKTPKALLTFVGFHDPFCPGVVEGQQQIGPVLTMIGEVGFEKVWLFSTEKTEQRAQETGREIEARHGVRPATVPLGLSDPTDYRAIIGGLRKHLPAILEQCQGRDIFVAVDAGTPQMHVCWLMLVLSGELPARLLQATPPRFAGDGKKLVKEIDLTGPEFPAIRRMEFGGGAAIEQDEAAEAVRELGIVGSHRSVLEAIKKARAAARSGPPVLISGESGTGKELFARLIWRLGPRRNGPFVAASLADKAPTLVESELFGHVRGAFTGAVADRPGLFDEANGGVLFLDEITLMSKDLQGKLLRVLQDGRYKPLGGGRERRSDFHLITATNEDIEEAVRERRFKSDLYYRIKVIQLRLPPLRERWTDIQLLALDCLDRINQDCREKKTISQRALNKLVHHKWPGNVRELQNVIRNAHALAEKPVIDESDISLEGPFDNEAMAIPEPYDGFSMPEYLKRQRELIIKKALDKSHGKQNQAARMLGIKPQALNKYLKKRP